MILLSIKSYQDYSCKYYCFFHDDSSETEAIALAMMGNMHSENLSFLTMLFWVPKRVV